MTKFEEWIYQRFVKEEISPPVGLQTEIPENFTAMLEKASLSLKNIDTDLKKQNSIIQYLKTLKYKSTNSKNEIDLLIDDLEAILDAIKNKSSTEILSQQDNE